jgi:hypothetical protein
MSELWRLSSEILDRITFLLSPDFVLMLCLCGDKRLNALLTMGGGVKTLNFKVRVRPKNVWPILPSYFPLLDQYSYRLYNPQNGAQEGRIQGLSISHLPGNLRYLLLDCVQIPTLLHLPISNNDPSSSTSQLKYCDLASLFPKLKTLILKGDTILEKSIFDVLPTSLTHLDLSPLDHSTQNIVSCLPRNLTYLRLNTKDGLDPQRGTIRTNISKTLENDDQFNEDSSIVFPPGLLTLESNFPWILKTARSMPSSLLRLHIGFDNAVTMEDLRHLPPNLTRLLVRGRVATTEKYSDFSCLPRSLTFIGFPKIRYQMNEQMAASLPPVLKEMPFASWGELNSFATLPRTLESIQLRSLGTKSSACIQTLPPHITQLETLPSTLSAKQVLVLPRTLQSLSVLALAPDSTLHLPLGLEILHLGSTLLPSEMRTLPSSLTRLNLNWPPPSVSEFLGDELEHLRNLKDMRVLAPASANLTPEEAVLMAKLIPKNLKKLSIHRFGETFRNMVLELGQNNHLETMYIYNGVVIPNKELFEAIPRTITDLIIGIEEGFDCTCLSALPPYLTSLKLIGSPTLLKEKDFELLPPTLTTFFLKGDFDRELCIKHLPRHVSSFSGGSNLYL